jgi:peptide/nickel transport system ATP-binding protein
VSAAVRTVAGTAPALAVRGLAVRAASGPLVEVADLTLPRGGTLGIVGESGSGKSMVAKALSGLLPAGVTATGDLTLSGAEIALDAPERAWRDVRGTRVALLLQDPFTSLSPVHRVWRQVAAGLPVDGPGAARGRRARREAAVARLAEVGLEPHVADRYPFELSGGMRQRVAIAAALAAEPDVLLADEPTTALDVTTQHGILELLGALQGSRHMGLVLITHDLELARESCDDLLVLYAGQVLEQGPAAELLARPAHPYTRALHEANPPLEVRLERVPAVPGSVPRAETVLDICPFAARCPLAHDACTAARPALVEVGVRAGAEPAASGTREPARRSACLLAEELLAAPPAPSAHVVAPTAAAEVGEHPGLVLAVRELTKRFPGAPRPALDGVSIEVRAGECLGIVGESGCGKTTLARCIVDLEHADDGEIRFLGPLQNGPSPVTRPRHTDVQIVFQDPYSALNPALTIGATLAEALHVAGRPAADVAELLDLVGLPAQYARRRPRGLSGGERQRVAIARALATRPKLLVCDESVSALDVTVQAQVLNLLADLRARLGLSLVFISHDLAVVRQVADRIVVMLAGSVVEEGAAEDVLSRPEHPYTRTLLAAAPGRGTSTPAAGATKEDDLA